MTVLTPAPSYQIFHSVQMTCPFMSTLQQCVCVCVGGVVVVVDTDSNVLYVHSVHDVLLIVSVYTCVCTLPVVQCMYCRSVQCYHVSSHSVGEARKCCLVMMYTFCFSFWHKVYMMLSILHFLFGQLIKDLNTSVCKLGV